MSRSAPVTTAVPVHVAVIMDGNGRWAKRRHLPRIAGHRAGIESVRAAVRTAGEQGVKFLTLYAFSVENWNRPKAEVSALMRMLRSYLRDEIDELSRNNVRLQAIGRLRDLPSEVQEELQHAITATRSNTGLTVILALSYSGRVEILEAVQSMVRDVQKGRLDSAQLDEEVFQRHLYTRDYPDPDLLIRTSGEMRLSNFLLWQLSYTELYVTETLWPDFRRDDLLHALEEFAQRHRRFGKV